MLVKVEADGVDYMVNGQKTFVTNGVNAGPVVTALKSDPNPRHKGITLIVIERV